MYIVSIVNDGNKTVIHGEREKLYSGKIVKGVNTIDTFTFAMLPNNAGFNLINEFTTMVYVYNTNKDRYEFMGRVLYPESEMTEEGLLTKKVTCESLFGFLCDSIQPYVATKNWTVAGLLSHLIEKHNSQVEEHKRFTVGTVTASDSNDNVYIGIERENTWDAIKSNMLDKIGGELQFRYGDKLYIDYLEEIGETKDTDIALSVNMKSIIRENDPTSYVTRLIPLGAKLSDDTEERLDITSVNNGLNYIDDADAIAAYGIHVGLIMYDDVTTASALLTKGRNWLAENNRVQVKYSISALDLSLLGLAVDDFGVGNYHRIKNPLLGIDDTARIIKQTLDICNEVASTIEVGDNFKTLTELQIEREKAAAQSIATLKQTVSELPGSIGEQVKQDLNAEIDQKIVVYDENLNQKEIFDRLTNNGELEGLYMENNNLYINASYIKAGTLVADLIKSGTLEGVKIIGESGSIGGWTISKSAIYKDVTDQETGIIYRVYLQPPVESAPDKTWVLSCQQSTNGGTSFTGKFILYSDGSAKFGGTTIDTSGEVSMKSEDGDTVSLGKGRLKLGNSSGNTVTISFLADDGSVCRFLLSNDEGTFNFSNPIKVFGNLNVVGGNVFCDGILDGKSLEVSGNGEIGGHLTLSNYVESATYGKFNSYVRTPTIIGPNENVSVAVKTYYALYVKDYSGQYPQEVIASNFTTSCSEKWKENIEEAGDIRNIIQNGKIYKYNRKTDKENPKTEYGLILERECPEELMNTTKDGVDTFTMMAMLWHDYQRTLAEKKALEDRVAAIEKHLGIQEV